MLFLRPLFYGGYGSIHIRCGVIDHIGKEKMEVSVLQDILGSVLYYRRVYFGCNGRDRYCGDGIFHGAADRFFQQNGGGAAAVWEGKGKLIAEKMVG